MLKNEIETEIERLLLDDHVAESNLLEVLRLRHLLRQMGHEVPPIYVLTGVLEGLTAAEEDFAALQLTMQDMKFLRIIKVKVA